MREPTFVTRILDRRGARFVEPPVPWSKRAVPWVRDAVLSAVAVSVALYLATYVSLAGFENFAALLGSYLGIGVLIAVVAQVARSRKDPVLIGGYLAYVIDVIWILNEVGKALAD